jgi:signal transduction histidine kinase
MVIRPIRDSVGRAASDLRAAVVDPHRARSAIRDVSLALENHLDTLARELQESAEPRLIEQTGRLEAVLRDALTETWAIDRDLRAGPVDQSRLAALATRLEKAVSAEFDLVAEQLRGEGALD